MSRHSVRRGRIGCAIALLAGLAAQPAAAALSEKQIATVMAVPPAGAAIPLDLPLASGGPVVPFDALLAGRPSLLILADYRCTQLCGSLLGIASNALHASGLRPNVDFNLLVVGFNPEAGAGDGEAMRQEQLGLYPNLGSAARFVTGTPEDIAALEAAVGFVAIRDADAGRFAHPADIFVLTADGHVSRVLNGLSLDAATVRLALVEAGQGRIGSLVDRLHVLCYGLDPLTGASSAVAEGMLKTGAGLTLVGGAVLIALAARRRASPARKA